MNYESERLSPKTFHFKGVPCMLSLWSTSGNTLPPFWWPQQTLARDSRQAWRHNYTKHCSSPVITQSTISVNRRRHNYVVLRFITGIHRYLTTAWLCVREHNLAQHNPPLPSHLRQATAEPNKPLITDKQINKLPRKILNEEIFDRKKQEGPWKRWITEEEEDLRRMSSCGWRVKT